MRILLLSAYDAQSHQHWRKLLVEQMGEHQWSVLTLPGRFFSWRIRGNSMSWAFGEAREILSRDYDLLIATSMTDLSALRGFIPELARIPTLVYFHENQFAYPLEAQARAGVEPQILNIYTALCADFIAFNSHYNRDSFLSGAAKLLKKLPDQVPSNCLTQLRENSHVLPVPLANATQSEHAEIPWQRYAGTPLTERPLLISWAARWEYDKGPGELLATVEALEKKGVDYRLCILGQQFRHSPDQFEQLQRHFGHRIDQFGFAQSQAQYRQWLSCSDIFLSTALHEFQGLSVLEAVQLGCIPCLPKRLVYPELFSDAYLYEGSKNTLCEGENAAQRIITQRSQRLAGELSVPHMPFQWAQLAASYRDAFTQCCSNFTRGTKAL
ncbi:MAG: tRNA-queuosine alpha-mannosyltransferase domain-containing protein [Pseudomonadales bacterium]